MRDELTPREVAAELGVTVRTVQRWIAQGKLTAVRVGGRMRVPRDALAAIGGEVTTAAPSARRPIRALLIANRGEIAIRVARTAHRLGMRVIRVHEPGEPAPEDADQALAIPSYLDGDALVATARRAGADAVHPGYGFLAENPSFADAVQAAGLAWIGPPAPAMAAMGDKAAARRVAAAHGVPVVPGYDGPIQDDAALARAAWAVGFPLLIKPAAGGGGKGLRVAGSADDLGEQLAAARREAFAAFGDDRLILERRLDGARHVEIQVLFDAHGHGVQLGERDCSAQRRRQKVVEEAPGPAVSPLLREALGQAALTVAGAVGYVGAGTVEFLVTDEGSFHFLEMNTRLQVEHPVTEALTGRDLVEDQLRIAAGEPLGFGQAAVRWRGHAIEARLYAEDAENGFLPATGRILDLRWPTGAGIRVDAGVRQGDRVTDRYDPLLAKVIAHGQSREQALGALQRALTDTRLLGVRTNLRFLRWLLAQPALSSGEMRTDTLARMVLPGPIDPPDMAFEAAAAALARPGIWYGGWRPNQAPVVRVSHGNALRGVAPVPSLPVVRAGDVAFVGVGGQSLEFRLESAPRVDETLRHATRAEGTALLLAPMPGRVLAVRHGPGDTVRAHDPVVVIEAMKMEHAVSAPITGRLTAIHVRPGQQVQRGDLLAEVRHLESDR